MSAALAEPPAVSKWLDPSQELLADVVARKMEPEESAVAAEEPLTTVATLAPPMAPGERRRLLRLAIDRASRERIGPGPGPDSRWETMASYVQVPGDWMGRVGGVKPNGHSPRCACDACRRVAGLSRAVDPRLTGAGPGWTP